MFRYGTRPHNLYTCNRHRSIAFKSKSNCWVLRFFFPSFNIIIIIIVLYYCTREHFLFRLCFVVFDSEYIHFDLMLCKRTDFRKLWDLEIFTRFIYCWAFFSLLFFAHSFVCSLFGSYGWRFAGPFSVKIIRIPSQESREKNSRESKKKSPRLFIWLCECDWSGQIEHVLTAPSTHPKRKWIIFITWHLESFTHVAKSRSWS